MKKYDTKFGRKKIVLYGGTGQAKVVRPIIESYGLSVAVIIDDSEGKISPFTDKEIVHGVHGLKKWMAGNDPEDFGFIVTIGAPHGHRRIEIHEILTEMGLDATTIIDPNAIVSESVQIGAGSQIMAGAIIMPETVIGNQCIINTKSSIDHECVIADGCEISPGATLCGSIIMERNSWVAAGATVLPWLKIGENSIVGAGTTLRKNLPRDTKYIVKQTESLNSLGDFELG